jgi:transposase InsO family protein
MVRLAPTTNDLSASGFAHLYMREIFLHYGFPLKIVSDRGTQWNSDLFKALCRRSGVELSMSTAFHPQTNGLVERTNEVVEAALRHYISADLSDWDDMLPRRICHEL